SAPRLWPTHWPPSPAVDSVDHVRPLALAVGSFVMMEPLTALTHRYVMHGAGRVLHRSHHTGTRSKHGFEANDAFPVMFSGVVLIGLAIGFNVPGWSFLVPVGVGITAYGVAYATVHDVYIHRRVAVFGDRHVPVLERLAAAHRVHHDDNGAPYGMLLPVVGRRSGSRPSHRPDEL
ncbi:MAG: crtZ, partial [Ilumatobacteraceae bacterium]|nr:crtZ [Ilumatobacteraceae bacterium]